MTYRSRLTLAVAVSAMVHLTLFVAFGPGVAKPSFFSEPEPESMVVRLVQPEEQERPQFIDSGAPTEEPPPEDTNLVSVDNTRAQDRLQDGGDTQPNFEIVEDIFDPGNPADEVAPPQLDTVAESTESAPSIETPPSPEGDAESEPSEEQADTEGQGPISSEWESTPTEDLIAAMKVENEEEGGGDSEEGEAQDDSSKSEESVEAPFQVAQAPQQAAQTVPEIGIHRGPETGGADAEGDESFAAKEHVLGEYMREVRRRVERSWRTSLQLKYSGLSGVRAVLKCTISPDGEVLKVDIVEKGNSLVYAALCKQAIERAGPFGSFPFDVPPIYRTQNLEIEWTFSLFQ